MPKNNELKKILVIGSGPIVIGQAAEFDYAGTQACQALKEEGIEVVLINSNPATIMTDTNMADKVYIEPITLEFVTQIIRQERPDGLLPTLGGQTGLNMAVELARAGVLERENVKLLGTQLTAIEKAEDRDLFRDLMRELEQPVPDSDIVTTVEEAVDFANEIGYPIIVRPAYTLGGTGGGICRNEEELREIVAAGIRYSPIGQCLIEKIDRRHERSRIRSYARRERQLYRRLQHGELRSGWRTYGRQHRRCAKPDVVRPRVPNAAFGFAENHPRAEYRRRLQRTVRA